MKSFSKSAIFLLILTLLTMIKIVPIGILIIYLIISPITFFVYSLDKNAAENNTWRISENTLHLLSIFGGWPGALYAQQKLRHKTKKEPFRQIFMVTVFLNIAILIYLISPYGAWISNFLKELLKNLY